MSKKLITTPILNRHGRIGPFFLKEGLVIGGALIFVTFVMMQLSAYLHISAWYVILVPALGLSIVTMFRLFFIKKITSPLYLEWWIAKKLVWPKSILPDSPTLKRR